MTFFRKLESLALAKGKALRSVALEVGFDPSAPAQWKRRGSAPKPDIGKRLADYFGVSVEDLLDDARELPGAPARPRQLPAPPAAGPAQPPAAPPVDPGSAAILAALAALKTQMDARMDALEAKQDAALAALHAELLEEDEDGLSADHRRAIRAELAAERRAEKRKAEVPPPKQRSA